MYNTVLQISFQRLINLRLVTNQFLHQNMLKPKYLDISLVSFLRRSFGWVYPEYSRNVLSPCCFNIFPFESFKNVDWRQPLKIDWQIIFHQYFRKMTALVHQQLINWNALMFTLKHVLSSIISLFPMTKSSEISIISDRTLQLTFIYATHKKTKAYTYQ